VFLSTINTQPSTGPANFSVKEKDEASLSNGFRQDSLDAFILRFVGVKAFLFFVLVLVLVLACQAIFENENEDEDEDDSFRAGLSITNPFRGIFAEPN
jgi:preprotein translocase subunit SecG